jgi:hypothetical protein
VLAGKSPEATRKQENNLQAAILAALRKRDGGAVVSDGSPAKWALLSRPWNAFGRPACFKAAFAVCRANCQYGSQLIHRRKSPEAALKRARLLKICYDVHIITPEGRDYASSEFGDLPRTPRVLQAVRKT